MIAHVVYRPIPKNIFQSKNREATVGAGGTCDAAENVKHDKHYASVVASDHRNAFTPVTVNETTSAAKSGPRRSSWWTS